MFPDAQAGADFSAKNAQLETPLHHACSMMDIAIVAILLNRGADESARNSNNETCADVLGHGLDEEAGGGRGDPGIRKQIAAMLARAPAERAWRRRSWIVMMRSREDLSAFSEDDGIEGGDKGKKPSSASSLALALVAAGGTVAARSSASGDGRDEKHRCRAGKGGTGKEDTHVQGVDKDGANVLGLDTGLQSCVTWVVRAQEEGIFREVVAFL